jgi:hypothetical protein
LIDVSGIGGVFLVAYFAVELAPCERHSNVVPDAGFVGVPNGFGSIVGPAHSISSRQDRERAQRFQPAGAFAQAPIGMMTAAGDGAPQSSVDSDETGADDGSRRPRSHAFEPLTPFRSALA